MDVGKGQVIGLSALDQTRKAVEKYTTTVSKSGWILVLEKQYFSFLDEKSRQKIKQKLNILEDLFDMRLKEIDRFQNELDKSKPYKTLKLEHPKYTPIKVKINNAYNQFNEQKAKMFKESIIYFLFKQKFQLFMHINHLQLKGLEVDILIYLI